MNRSSQTVIFLGNGRCYHTLDWFRSAQLLLPSSPPILVTDLIDGESFEKLITDSDLVVKLFIIDKWLLNKQSRFGNVWRNIFKFLVLPLQILKFRKILKNYHNPIVHAHTMYYTMISRFSSCNYVSTPQGGELLVRPYESSMYKSFARIALSKASHITVDSIAMRESLSTLFGLKSVVIQNGIDLESINKFSFVSNVRKKVVSIRGFSAEYQLDYLFCARKNLNAEIPLYFCYPFVEIGYKNSLVHEILDIDRDLGRLSRMDLYQLLLSAKLVISIPYSDSSPRSVYEAIFCGCFVAATYDSWVSQLPSCMASRVIVVDLKSSSWLQDAIDYVDNNINIPYIPSLEAIHMFDQKQSMLKIYKEIYPMMDYLMDKYDA